MKNQYFGDNRDLFKYDLIMHIMQSGLIERFAFIPMLTKNDNNKEGGKTNREKARSGTANKELMNFLDECVNKNIRDVKQLESFFTKCGVSTAIYYGKDKYFSHERREKYFKEIDDELLSKSLIFVDPDIGLQVKRTRDKHIKYTEVQNIYQRMDKDSILMLYQHFPHIDHREYLNTKMEELKEKITGDFPVCIDDNEIIFFFLTKNSSLEHSLIHAISHYEDCYS